MSTTRTPAGSIDGAEVSPVVVEVIRSRYVAIAEEMSVSLFRGAHTPVIYEAKDCAVGVYDRQARLLGQAPGLPIFLGNIQACIEHVTEKVGFDGYSDGDVFVLNDSYVQGSHLTDITVLAPIFVDGRLEAFAATRADGGHLGGADLGVSTSTTHIYAEGMRVPAVRLVKAGVVDDELMELLCLNSFFHSARRGDLEAQIAACYKGAEGMRALYARYGHEVVRAATADIFRQSEELDRAAIAALPDGTYRASGLIDSDGVGPDPVHVEVAVTVAGEEMTVDLAGSSPMRPGPVNSGRVQAVSAARVAFKELVHPDAPVTGGSFRNLHVRVPERSVFDAREPAPMQWYYTPLGLLIDLVLKALAPVLPDRVAAAHFGDSMIVSFHGTRQLCADGGTTGEDFVVIDAESGGWGAFAGGDGQDCMINVINGDFKNLPIEFVEHAFPLAVEAYAMRQDSEGAGRWRGGLGVSKTFRVLQDGTRVSTWLDRSLTPAWGLFGGEEASGPVAVVEPGTERERRVNKVTDVVLEKGQRITVHTGGGGGYGEASGRCPEQVDRDVREGYVSPGRARRVYGWDG